jgi:ATP adenylyltransferase/5',5'''-P-1,P-4-tetraphosphate phosphorylase II
MLTSLPSIYAIFNCSEAAGCSRVHKHMQGLIGPPTAFDLFTGSDEESTKIPFAYFAHHFTSGFSSTPAVELLSIYENLLAQTRSVLGVSETDVTPHNVILWRDWIILVPRRRAAVEKASANAAGMLGSIWVPDRSGVDEWLSLGSKNVLMELGVPALGKMAAK